MTPDTSSADPIVLHSSLRRTMLAAIGPAALLALGLYGLSQRVWWLTIAVTLFGAVLACVVVFDLPLRAEFSSDGVTRVCALRRQRLPWSRIVALERVQGRPQRRGEIAPRVRGAQGLVARLGPRRVSLLVDRRESLPEFLAIRHLVDRTDTLLRAGEPDTTSPPAGRGPRALHRREA